MMNVEGTPLGRRRELAVVELHCTHQVHVLAAGPRTQPPGSKLVGPDRDERFVSELGLSRALSRCRHFVHPFVSERRGRQAA